MIAYVLVTALITSAKTSKLQLYFSTILGFEHIQNGSIIMIPQSSHAAQWQNITERVHYSASSSTVSLYTVFTIQYHIYSHTFTKSLVLPSQRVDRHIDRSHILNSN